MSNKQAPDSCPFCGSEPLTEGEEKWSSEIGKYRCGTISHAFEPDDRWQTSQCRIAERKRLTRERDGLRAAHTNALNQIGDLCMENANLLARVKQLESEWAGWPDLQREWFGDKYAAMQPLEAVRARIEDAEDRAQRLEEERGDWSRCADNLHKAILSAELGANFLSYQATEDAMAEFDALKAKEATP